MRKVTTLTGKNLPRLAVAKPGWPESRLMTVDERIEMERLTAEIDSEVKEILRQRAVADFTRVCDQTGLSEKLRKD